MQIELLEKNLELISAYKQQSELQLTFKEQKKRLKPLI